MRDSRSQPRLPGFGAWPFIFFAASMIANGQFKEVGPPPFSATVARQRIGALLENVDAANRRQTVETLSGLLVWYRDLVDEELIAAWQKDGRANLPEVMEPLADSRVALAVVEFSWRQRRQATFNLTYAPMLGRLMARYSESAAPFLTDLLGPVGTAQRPPDLSPPEAEAVCRILLDMPDTGTWEASALRILPHYREAAESLLARDMRGDDQEKTYRARYWLARLNGDTPGIANQPPRRRERSTPSRLPAEDRSPGANRPVSATIQPGASADQSAVDQPRADRSPAPVKADSAPVRAILSTPPASPAPLSYDGTKSGTLECRGGPIPQNAEYVFRDVPPAKLRLDYDTKIWDARLSPGDGRAQRLVLTNKSSGPQKRCVVHWSVIP